jgi:hypothetical protein
MCWQIQHPLQNQPDKKLYSVCALGFNPLRANLKWNANAEQDNRGKCQGAMANCVHRKDLVGEIESALVPDIMEEAENDLLLFS